MSSAPCLLPPKTPRFIDLNADMWYHKTDKISGERGAASRAGKRKMRYSFARGGVELDVDEFVSLVCGERAPLVDGGGAELWLEAETGETPIFVRCAPREEKDGFSITYLASSRSSARALPHDVALRASVCALALCCRDDAESVRFYASAQGRDGEVREHKVRVIYARDAMTVVASATGALRRRAAEEKRRAVAASRADRGLPFPYSSLREGQRELIGAVNSVCRRGGRLFAEAPTGIGKTASVLYGAIRAMHRGGYGKIFYLTAKASTGREAFAAAAKIYSAGADLRTVTLTAKEHVCPHRVIGKPYACTPATCELMRGYSRRAPTAVSELLDTWHGYSVSAVASCAAKHGVCPYELSLDLSEYCDIVICDYNYAFDPCVKLKRYFSGEKKATCVFLIDEAHNLPERAREIYSARICRADVAAALRAVPFGSTADALRALDGALADLGELCREETRLGDDGIERGFYYSASPLSEFNGYVEAAGAAIEKFCYAHKGDDAAVVAGAFLRLCEKWNDAAEHYDEKYRTYVETRGEETEIKLFCLDPSRRLDTAMRAAHASILFSATLSPADYFASVLGGGSKFEKIVLPSPFPPERRFVATVGCISTRFEDRDKSARRVSTVIAAVASAKKGNYIVYFPSYGYLNKVLPIFAAKYPSVPTAVQKPHMTRAEKEEFLAFFKNDNGKLRIGFCVLGGSFSEGVDLPGSRLIGTVIVGVGLPGLSAEKNMIREYFDADGECGYDYAYTYPGLNNVMQAAGRVIRKIDDRGVIVLVDDRYTDEKYARVLPEHFKGALDVREIGALPALLADFWRESDDSAKSAE